MKGGELLAFYILIYGPGFEAFSKLVMASEEVYGLFNLGRRNAKGVEWGKRVACIDDQARFIVDDFCKEFFDDALIRITFRVQRVLVNKSGRTAALRSKVNG